MRALALIFCLALTSCTCVPLGIYPYKAGGGGYTGFAINTEQLLGLVHGGARVGDEVFVLTQRGKQRARVVSVRGDLIIIEGEPNALDLQLGDSGSPVLGVLNKRGRRRR